jgi:hypothetical protein
MDQSGKLGIWLAGSLAFCAACGDHGDMVAQERASGGSGMVPASVGGGGMPASGGSMPGDTSTGGAPSGGSAGQTNGGAGAGPGCQFRVVPGNAIITSIQAATQADGSLCPGGSMSVRYEFVADDAALSPASYDVATYGFDSAKYHQLRVPYGSTPYLLPLGCVEKLGLAVGDTLADNRSLITAGSCTPASDAFPNLDLASCASLCS